MAQQRGVTDAWNSMEAELTTLDFYVEKLIQPEVPARIEHLQQAVLTLRRFQEKANQCKGASVRQQEEYEKESGGAGAGGGGGSSGGGGEGGGGSGGGGGGGDAAAARPAQHEPTSAQEGGDEARPQGS